MAKLKGIFKFTGSLDGYTVYKLNGEYIIRKKGVVAKERILRDDEFKGQRETMSEFGGAATMGKAIRTGWAVARETFGAKRMAPVLQGIIKSKIAPQGEGPKGQRQLSIRNNPGVLLNFPFNPRYLFHLCCNLPVNLATHPERNAATLTIPRAKSDEPARALVKAPSGATHYRIWLLINTISDYHYHPEKQSYVPVCPTENEKYALARTDFLPVDSPLTEDLVLTATLNDLSQVSPDVSVIACIGIEYSQKTHQTYNNLVQQTSMKVAAIF
ncbi:MAG: hypothetical protein H6581_10730 [Bacteroidia bacterium]|nr:hypothetical protein [Bacteroidia bacterium]